MHIVTFIIGVLLVAATLLDTFETILLPRRINHRLRFSRFYYRGAWHIWRQIARFIPNTKWREAMLGIFGPLSLLGLFGSWLVCLIISFAIMQRSLPPGLVMTQLPSQPQNPPEEFLKNIYFSGSTFFTLGLGDVAPVTWPARMLTVVESGLGLGFLALIIAYLPVLYQAFSKREVTISLMDARAGSPPSGAELLLRLARAGRIEKVEAVLADWERWCAELLESHISFPVLGYYRSQHGNQSWLASLATMLDASALLLAILPDAAPQQAQLTLAMARHAAVDIGLIFGIPPQKSHVQRLPPEMHRQLHQLLRDAGRSTSDTPQSAEKLTMLRGLYEPFLEGLATHFLLTLPPMLPAERIADNWQRSAWMPRTPGIGDLGAPDGAHFD
jgi:hypothetical protein